MQLFASSTKNVKNRNKEENKRTSRRKAVAVVAMTILLSASTGMQAYAAGTAYTLLSRIAAGSDYPAVEGLAIEKGQAYVLKYGGENGCTYFYGEKTGLTQLKDKKGNVISLEGLGHGNDMTYRKADKKLYIATMKDSIKRMPLSGDEKKIEEIKTNYDVGSIACWLNSDKFILKRHKSKREKEEDKRTEFHLVQINGTKVTEICTFMVKEDDGEEFNQGICMYKGYLYVTFWNNKNNNSYIYKVNEKMSAIEKKGKNTKATKIYGKTKIAMIDKNELIKSAKNLKKPPKGTPIKIEIESIAFTTEDYLYFTANAQYLDTSNNKKSLDGLYRINKKMA